MNINAGSICPSCGTKQGCECFVTSFIFDEKEIEYYQYNSTLKSYVLDDFGNKVSASSLMGLTPKICRKLAKVQKMSIEKVRHQCMTYFTRLYEESAEESNFVTYCDFHVDWDYFIEMSKKHFS